MIFAAGRCWQSWPVSCSALTPVPMRGQGAAAGTHRSARRHWPDRGGRRRQRNLVPAVEDAGADLRR